MNFPLPSNSAESPSLNLNLGSNSTARLDLSISLDALSTADKEIGVELLQAQGITVSLRADGELVFRLPNQEVGGGVLIQSLSVKQGRWQQSATFDVAGYVFSETRDLTWYPHSEAAEVPAEADLAEPEVDFPTGAEVVSVDESNLVSIGKYAVPVVGLRSLDDAC